MVLPMNPLRGPMTRLRRVPRRTVWIALGAILWLGAAPLSHACVGACCGVPEPRGEGSHETGRAGPAPHSCCCGETEKLPCDLEQAPADQDVDGVLSAVPRLEDSSQAAALPVAVARGPETIPQCRPGGGKALAQGPPGPIYLRNLSLLC